ncbi:NAD-dependent epimerase/dehydratase family protein [Amycolatopsis sp. FBCC-B4732]|uniref:NAD-dependent epimerase/dehydratase family protein n=1 Tax=Amycolatopsis sp. FBCC-B4732 TaxID=3079339 RepID=UPI001FF6AD86|nr:NAD-dependent epimerase/dehydratase family protein [Amycolatopsis sp. FBCC-B4732]UOX92306.1 NAD-dependent epimerase/dehydratase family protein [Amycolatopsis sp. FBCC-B4732]
MRIVITGATGNVGTALLAALEPGHDVAGLARRLPDPAAEPYRSASWHALDIGGPGAEEELTTLFEGADAVVHLAWAISPRRGEPPMWRTNDDGTRHVLAAVAAAGVPHLVVASSVAAYGPAPRWEKVGEDHPCTGIARSAYSRGKAALESRLDRFEAQHPEVGVARLRPCAILQRRAAGDFARWLLDPVVPARLVGGRRLPVPLWHDLRAQAVHTDDVAEAIRLILGQGFTGPVNLAAPGVLDADELAAVLGGRRLPVPKPLASAAVLAAWAGGVLPVHPGWLELADRAALAGTTVAETVLGWQPRYDAASAIAELVAGLRSGAGAASPPLPPPRGSGVLARLRSLTRVGPSHQSQA